MRGLDNALVAAKVHNIELQDGSWFSQEGVRAIQSVGGSDKKFDVTSIAAVAGVAATAAVNDDRAIEVVIGGIKILPSVEPRPL